MRNQQTLARSAVVEGFGFWTGRDIRVEFCPSSEDSGIRFIRTDLPGEPSVPALVQYRVAMPRQTSLVNGPARVDMIEHVMAALRGAGIDNCDIRVDGPEMPGCDGSSAPFFDAIMKSGIETQSQIMPWREIASCQRIAAGDGCIDVAPATEHETRFGYSLQYNLPEGEKRHPIGSQVFDFTMTRESFEREVVMCRTFLLLKEAQYLVSQGLCSRVTPKDVLVFDENGPVENTLRFDNECARHKVLDMIGDFALAPNLWVGQFRACRTGHEQNAHVVRLLMETTPLRR